MGTKPRSSISCRQMPFDHCVLFTGEPPAMKWCDGRLVPHRSDRPEDRGDSAADRRRRRRRARGWSERRSLFALRAEGRRTRFSTLYSTHPGHATVAGKRFSLAAGCGALRNAPWAARNARAWRTSPARWVCNIPPNRRDLRVFSDFILLRRNQFVTVASRR